MTSLIENIKSRSHELDPCTQSNYTQFQVKHTTLTLGVSFEDKVLTGTVVFELVNKSKTDSVILDTAALDISQVKVNSDVTPFKLAPAVPIYGSALHISIPTNDSTVKVEIDFRTTDKCTAIQFIAGDTGPYVFSQCQAIHARSLFPCFDTPGVKSTYTFTAKSPSPCTMSGRPRASSEAGVYHFDQPIPIPSYLVSLTSGNLLKAPIGPRSDVYCEEPNLKACQWEFEKDMENYIQIAEALIFDYEWDRFDSLVLPSSFPYGGMEIPNMTQLTPTLICGDRTQTKVMAHELSHSWSGNLVTNCSWEHFWLNEGWTVYLERRILGAIAAKERNSAEYGEQVRHFNMIIGWNGLVESVNGMPAKFTKLVWDLQGQDPDDAFSKIPYEKGFFFLFHLETKLGGLKEFDPFIKHYFKKFRYGSLNSAQFVETLYEFYEPLGKKQVLDSIDWDTWLFKEGVPEYPKFDTTLADQVYSLVDKWVAYVEKGGEFTFSEADVQSFEGEQEMLFLETLVEKFKQTQVTPELIRKIPSVYPKYSASGNGEFISRWNELLITFGKYSAGEEVVQKFATWLGSVGRMKYVRPGYKLLSSGVSLEFARETFAKYEQNYHPICHAMVKKDLQLV
ncbi:leukotriene A-4 hydrolase [Spathaspora passalidarum NRRL Y-27907]|uniref:Leukotriene A(4) hydrolase n=1 Tax=Spathaspora passalidarum (strain NRRL Y-27907 / 11-Y1) TaxID=619300 RepID=G3AQ27_SPAPN|nr:leukotriene A-4 hydrolase [Spathaspora passalidarum NRRL Y-27907]EGW32348.1 leukotriene A-4 hydrolase [Spathaspora passalidarum NRRL Y-27907]